MERQFPNGRVLRLVVGDITRFSAAAIVNAANSGLRGGGGVDGAIHRVGGPAIMEELNRIRDRTGGCPPGGAVVTAAGNLPADHVFHAVGPIYRDGKHNEPQLLASCYRTCLQSAEELGTATISFPSISTGAYGYPIGEAAAIAIREVSEHLAGENTKLREVIFVLFSKADYEVYCQALAEKTGRQVE